MLLSVVLYGSRARGDHRSTSDVDLLGLIESGPLRREISAGGTSLYHYPAGLLSKQSKDGSLFALHLASEGKILHDTVGVFSEITRNFRYKVSYDSEVDDACLIVHFFNERVSLLRKKSARKRLVWAIRTILIARAAEIQQPRFSSSSLAAFSKIPELKNAIDNRSSDETELLIKVANRVVNRYGNDVDWPKLDRKGQRNLMISKGGIVKDTVSFAVPAGIKLIKNSIEDLVPSPGFGYLD